MVYSYIGDRRLSYIVMDGFRHIVIASYRCFNNRLSTYPSADHPSPLMETSAWTFEEQADFREDFSGAAVEEWNGDTRFVVVMVLERRYTALAGFA